MKKIFVLFLLIFLSLPTLFSQALQYDIKVKYNKGNSGTTADITITVKAGDPSFTYFLMTNDPMKGDVLMKTGPVKSKNCVFKDIKPGKYFIRIEDNMGLPAGKTVEIKELAH
jgi:hypothetical protein